MRAFYYLGRSRRTAFVAAALAGIALSTSAQAGTSAGTIDLELNITSACLVNGAATQPTLGSLGSIVFDAQPGTFTSTDGQLGGSAGAGITVRCSPGSTPVLTFGTGAHDNASSRRLALGSVFVPYRLYSNAGRTDEITIGKQISLTDGPTVNTVPIYARATNDGNPLGAGKYTDTVQVVLTW